MSGSSRIIFAGNVVSDQFPVFIGAGPACRSGLTTSDFQVEFFRNCDVYSTGFGLNEIGTTGQYRVSFQFDLPGYYEVQISNNFNNETYYETYDVFPAGDIVLDPDDPFVQRVFGLSNHNAVVDQRVYDVCGQVTSARIRLYNNAVNATGGTSTGLLYTYQITIEYLGPNKLKSFTQVLV